MRERLAICVRIDVPDDVDNLEKVTTKVFECSASLKVVNYQFASQLAVISHWQADPQQFPTHQFTIRNPSDVQISPKFHWAYRVNRFGRKEWFKIQSIVEADDRGDFITLNTSPWEIKDPRADKAILGDDVSDTFQEVEPDVSPLPAERLDLSGTLNKHGGW